MIFRFAGAFAWKRFAGFRSRWMMPAAWACARASSAWSAMSATSSGGSGPRRASSVSRSQPARYSITRYGEPFGSVPASMTRTTCSLVMRATVDASNEKRSITSLETAAPGKSALIATRWRRMTCSAS